MNPANDLHPLEITLADYLANWRGKPIQALDVREHDEWAAGHMAGAVLAPLGELERRLSELDLDPAAPTIVVCRSGRRSLIAAEYLAQRGFGRVRSLAGGLLAWAAAGQPLER
ncbi:MAG TPA: rhodanese-like domain-containing protein [Thermomicrobiales bacterium]|jgi:rhodanese-related sulfurtransferase|nr:rhodanese-like domain-containing protein [Thermomicrobiales bacterium]